MNAFKVIMDVMERWKPYMIKVIPIAVLRKLKRRYMKWNTDRLKKEKIMPFDPQHYEDGMNLIGNSKGDFGLGQSCRLIAWELKYSKIPFGIYEYVLSDDSHSNDSSCEGMLISEPKYNINLFHINANEFTAAYYRLGKKTWDYRYNIAFWLWELEEFPKDWMGCIDILDEIWTPSEFVSRAIRKRTNKPVITIPYHVEASADPKYDRKYFGLPEDQFLFLVMYDSNSMIERKNPMSALLAFKEAFSKENQKVGLIVKMNGKNQADMSGLRKYLDGYKNIYFIMDVLSKIEVNSLIAAANVCVSMHRAEGFGLVLAEAMLNHVPCIATNWSANTEFMNSDVACMLDYKLIPIEEDIGPFQKGNYWADADIHQAAGYMQKLYQDKEFYLQMAERAKQYVDEALGMKRITAQIKSRLKKIYEQGSNRRIREG